MLIHTFAGVATHNCALSHGGPTLYFDFSAQMGSYGNTMQQIPNFYLLLCCATGNLRVRSKEFLEARALFSADT